MVLAFHKTKFKLRLFKFGKRSINLSTLTVTSRWTFNLSSLILILIYDLCPQSVEQLFSALAVFTGKVYTMLKNTWIKEDTCLSQAAKVSVAVWGFISSFSLFRETHFFHHKAISALNLYWYTVCSPMMPPCLRIKSFVNYRGTSTNLATKEGKK
jgi:hypothetical protein